MREGEVKDIICLRNSFSLYGRRFLIIHYTVLFTIIFIEMFLMVFTTLYPNEVILLLFESLLLIVTSVLSAFPMRSYAIANIVSARMASAALLTRTPPPAYVWDTWLNTPVLCFTHPAVHCVTKTHHHDTAQQKTPLPQ